MSAVSEAEKKAEHMSSSNKIIICIVVDESNSRHSPKSFDGFLY
jgi:hypothetical protein